MRAAIGKTELIVVTVVVLAVLAVAFGLSMVQFQRNDRPALLGHFDNSPESIPPSLQPYARKPESGSMIALPSAPLVEPPAPDATNLLSNPGFEYSNDAWEMSGMETASGSPTDVIAAKGIYGFQLIPSPETDARVFQTIKLKPRTFYSFTALTFAPGPGEAVLEVSDILRGTVLVSNATKGPMQKWSQLPLVFITRGITEKTSVGVRCLRSAESAPVVVDELSLYELPTENSFPSGNMETEPEPEQAPMWYFRGKTATRVQEGYESEFAIEMPVHAQRVSKLVGLIPRQPELAGKPLWISAMIRSTAEEGSPPLDVTMTFQFTDALGTRMEASTELVGTGDWTEASLAVTLPKTIEADSNDIPPFDLLLFTCPAGASGRIVVDEVMMLVIPQDHFGGGLTQAPQLN